MQNIDELQEIHKRGLKVQGTRFLIGVAQTTQQITVPGAARSLLGIRWNYERIDTTAAVTWPITMQFTLTINNDVMLKDCAIQTFSDAIAQKDMFFPFPRPLNGNDDITVTTNNPVAASFYVIFHLYYF
jgi:hypothetical protein